MVLLLFISLLTGVPDDFEFPPDLIQFSDSGGQLFLGVWDPGAAEEDQDDQADDLPGIVQDSPAGGGDEFETLAVSPCEDAEAARPAAMLFWPLPDSSLGIHGMPRIWTSEPPADSLGQALYFWTEDEMMEQFLLLHGEETLYLVVEARTDAEPADEETYTEIRIMEVSAGDITFSQWMEGQ